MAMDDNTSRRTVLAAAAGGAAVAASGAALAQTPRAKGPRVWLDMDQQELDDAYDQIVYAPNREQVGKRRVFNSERTRAAIGAPERVGYGPSEIEKLDIYRTKQANAPVNVFVHGGAWRHGDKSSFLGFYGMLASNWARHGIGVVVPNYRLSPGVSHPEHIKDVARAFGAALSHLAFLGLAYRRLRGDARLGNGRAAAQHPQGCHPLKRHVRSQAGAAFQALEIREVHGRDGAGAQRAAASR